MKFLYCICLFLLWEGISVLASPISQTASSNRESALDAVKYTIAKYIDSETAIPLHTLRKTRRDDSVENIVGHNIPTALLKSFTSNIYPTLYSAIKDKRDTFNASAQLIDVTGDHVFVAPDFANGDVRGPCPGLNALANHGYLPHNGVANMAQFIEGCNKVFGMGLDVSTFLAIYGTVLAGDPLSLDPGFSIGGESAASQNLLGNVGGLLGEPRGISGTHNIFEVDASGTRGDLYDAVGDNYNLNMSYFMDLYNTQKDEAEPNYSLDVIIDHNYRRFQQSIATNPSFFYGPWSGLAVRNAAYCFTARLYTNSSVEHPEGILNKETLKSFFGVYGPENDMIYKIGWERIPDNWYRRPTDYEIITFVPDLLAHIEKYPVFLGIGGNINGVNTYTGLDPSNITGALFNAAEVLEGNNLLCFAFQFLREAAPNSLSSLYATIAQPLDILLKAFDSPLSSLACPAYKDLQIGGTNLFSYLRTTYPGARRSSGAL